MVKVYAPLSRYQVLGVVYATSSEASRGSSLEVDMVMLSVERVVNDEDGCGVRLYQTGPNLGLDISDKLVPYPTASAVTLQLHIARPCSLRAHSLFHLIHSF